jgi:hypothetical protein
MGNTGYDNGNLIVRGDCESTTAPMVTGETTPTTNNCTWERVLATDEGITAYAGDYVWKMTVTSTSVTTDVYLIDTSIGISDLHGFVPGLEYIWKSYFYTKSTGGVAPGVIDVYLYDYDGINYSNTMSNPSSRDTWNLVTITHTLQSDAIGFGPLIRIEAADAVAGEVYYFDCTRLVPVGTHNEHDQQYVDNGTGTQESSNSWQNAFPA